ncbi:MAG: hypothetical protein AVDCRST_MAG49-610, partial [uncultured Thermomicrobiales bacterium]
GLVRPGQVPGSQTLGQGAGSSRPPASQSTPRWPPGFGRTPSAAAISGGRSGAGGECPAGVQGSGGRTGV